MAICPRQWRSAPRWPDHVTAAPAPTPATTPKVADTAFAAAPFFDDVDEGPKGGHAVWAKTADDIRIRVAIWPLAGARGTVLLFPGRTEYAEKYGRAAADLASRGYATLAVDWRGQGLADRVMDDPQPGHIIRFGDYQNDVVAALAVAESQNLPRPWHLLAHSMGGCIGLRALHLGLPVQSAAFTGPMWGISLPAALRPIAWALAGGLTKIGLGTLMAPGVAREAYVLAEPFDDNKLTTDPDMYEYMRRQTRAHPEIGLGGPTMQWLIEALRETRALAAMPGPNLPCMTFLGGAERIVDINRIHQRMKNWPDARLEIIEGAEHEIMMEGPETRARLFNTLAGFFDSNAGATRADRP